MDKIKEIISEYTNIPASDIDSNMSLQADIGVDSFSLISMLIAIEEEFNVEIPEYEIKNFQTLEDINNYIQRVAY